MSNHHKFANSSSLVHCDYHDDTSTLEICFASGGTYRYPQVKKSIYEALKTAESPGKFFHAHVKPHFPGVKV